MALIVCPKCGKENQDGSTFCAACGAKLDAAFDVLPETDNQESLDSDAEQGEEPKQGFFHKPGGKALIIVIIAAIVAVVVVIAVMWHRPAQPLEEDVEAQSSPEEEDIIYDVNNLSEEQRDMLAPMDSRIIAFLYGFSFDDSDNPSMADPGYFWGSCSNLIYNYQYDFEDQTTAVTEGAEGVYATEDFVKECASTLFADFDGEFPSTLGTGVYKTGDEYVFWLGDCGEEDPRITSWIEYPDGTCTVEIQLLVDDTDELYAEYQFELVPNAYAESFTNPLFAYSLASMEETYRLAEDTTNMPDNYILPDSDTRYYTKSELTGRLSAEDLRLARNEIYARHGRIFDSEDLQEYFDWQTWYHGEIAPADFDESVLNEYEKANVKLILSIENNTFSFSDIDDTTFMFTTGVGAWAEWLTTYADGTFDGYYNDWDASGEDLEGNERNNVNYHSEYTGKFSDPVQVDAYTYSAKVEYINYKYGVNTEETIDDALYLYTTSAGIEEGENVLIYTPGMRLVDLSEDVISYNYNLWLDRENITENDILETYVICTTYGVFWH